MKTFDPVALGVPGGAVVTALDVWNTFKGTTVVVDDLVVYGVTVTDFKVARTA